MNRLFTLLLLMLPVLALAAPTPAPIFTDGAVLQQGANIPVWGRAEPGEHITVSFRDQQIGTTTDPDGNWQVLLAPIASDTSEADLSIQGSTTVTLHRLLVGDVWLCLGSSTLQIPLAQEGNVQAEIASGASPLLRYIDASAPNAPAGAQALPWGWHEASSALAPHFSAEALYFAKHLQRKTGVPIGIIKLSSSGTNPASWLSPTAITSSPELNFIPQRWLETQNSHPAKIQLFQQSLSEWKKAEQKARAAGPAKLANFLQKKRPPKEPRLQRPSADYETHLAPLQPYALKGLVWHEAGVEGMSAAEYAATTRAFIHSTRAHFGNPLLPFILVQLGPQPFAEAPNEENWALLREAQRAALEIPHTNMVVSLDMGGPKSVHPFNTQDLARRIANTALAGIYNIDIEYKGPSAKCAVLENGKLRVDFDHATTGLIAYKKPVQSLEIAGTDGRFHPASALIRGSSLIVSSPSVANPLSLRYAWNRDPYANLANGAGIPAAPFCITRTP